MLRASLSAEWLPEHISRCHLRLWGDGPLSISTTGLSVLFPSLFTLIMHSAVVASLQQPARRLFLHAKEQK